MKRQYFFLGVMMAAVFSVAGPVSADGGMMSVTQAVSTPTPAVAGASMTSAYTDEELQERIDMLTELVRLTSQVQALMLGVPETEQDDEGSLTVVVNEKMIAPCGDEEGQTGGECVRHTGKLGKSTADLATITGFDYDDRFAYDLTLVKTRSDDYGETTGAQYNYFLLRIEDVEMR